MLNYLAQFVSTCFSVLSVLVFSFSTCGILIKVMKDLRLTLQAHSDQYTVFINQVHGQINCNTFTVSSIKLIYINLCDMC